MYLSFLLVSQFKMTLHACIGPYGPYLVSQASPPYENIEKGSDQKPLSHVLSVLGAHQSRSSKQSYDTIINIKSIYSC